MRKVFPLSASGLSALKRDVGTFPGVPERLIQARKVQGSTQAEMAAQLGLSLRTYVRMEQGLRTLDADDLARLAELGVQIGWLLTGLMEFGRDDQDQARRAFAGLSEPKAHLDGDVLGQILEELLASRLPLKPVQMGRAVADIYDVVFSYHDPAERRGAIKVMLQLKHYDKSGDDTQN